MVADENGVNGANATVNPAMAWSAVFKVVPVRARSVFAVLHGAV